METKFCKVVHDGHTVYTGTYEDCVDFTEIWWEDYPGMDIIPDENYFDDED